MAAASVQPRGLAGTLAAAFALLILYASLYPFEGWRWPPGRTLADLLALPWPPYRPLFDLWSNGLGYLPLGLLVALAARGRRWPALAALALGVALPSALSYAAEVAQQFVPERHPSRVDWALNSAGAAAGALLALPLHRLGWPQRAAQALHRGFDPDARAALVLLGLWPVALLFPSPVALGLGQLWPRLRGTLAALLEDVPWAAPWHDALAAAPAAPLAPLSLPAEALTTTLGLLAPCLVAFTVVPASWRRIVLALGAAAVAGGMLALSTALTYGPQHALAWVAPSTAPAFAAAAAVGVALAWVPRRVATGLGLVALTALVVLVAQAPADPYFAQSLQGWEQGRFIRFHGLAQWVGLLWPYAALAWLLARLGRRG